MEKVRKQAILLYMTRISQNVRKLRGAMSQEEFGKRVGVSRTTIHRIESRKNFEVESLLRIAIACGLSPYEFCLTEEERQKLCLRTDLLVESFKEIIKREVLAELKQ